MKPRPPELLPLLRSDLQGELLARLFLYPEREYTLTELAELSGVAVNSVHNEVNRLADAGLVTERRVGRARLVRSDPTHRLTRPLTELLELSYGPAAILPTLLTDLPGSEQTFIFGSWAARRSGVAGPPPGDVDILVVGRPSRGAMARVQRAARERLGLEVNLVRIEPDEWESPTTGFTRTVKEGPLVPLTPVAG